jgi:hypothetical protein
MERLSQCVRPCPPISFSFNVSCCKLTYSKRIHGDSKLPNFTLVRCNVVVKLGEKSFSENFPFEIR